MVIHIYQTSSLNSQYIPYYQDWRLLKDLRPAGGEAAKDLAVAFVKGNQTVWKDALDLSEVSNQAREQLHAHAAHSTAPLGRLCDVQAAWFSRNP